jgi:hypothetical protein
LTLAAASIAALLASISASSSARRRASIAARKTSIRLSTCSRSADRQRGLELSVRVRSRSNSEGVFRLGDARFAGL